MTTALPDASLPALPPASLPAACDVLVIGAGPAGCAVATTLARAGRDVWLVDQHTFPREKVCGDGLIPDAHRALKRLGVLEQVMAVAQPVSHVRCVGPSGGFVDVPGTLAVLPRLKLDEILVRNAQAAGVKLATPVKFEALLTDGNGPQAPVRGARLLAGGVAREVRARWVVMATGASMGPMIEVGLCERRAPSGIALRGYVHAPALRERLTRLEVVWHKALRPGYGWIFPAGDDLFNIGVGAFHGAAASRAGPQANLRKVFDAFTTLYAPARELMAAGTLQGELKGAPLRCMLDGARYSRPGLLATGEAIGSTYDFTGEGIGKAMETGLLAADALLEGEAAGRMEAAIRADYEQRVATLQPKFALYAKANRVNKHPWLADLVIGRAKKSPRLLRRMTGVLEETSNPGHLISVRGLYKLFTE
ncbi:MAG: geranylgeranyl reductase family protein [Burkholderiales bacterium]